MKGRATREGPGTIALVRPDATTAQGGNMVTSERWQGIFERLGWRTRPLTSWDGGDDDILVAIHARKSHDSILRFAREHPERPLIVVGSGTDLYTDVEDGGEVRESLGLATRIVVLQPLAFDVLPAEMRAKARVIHQSVEPRPGPPPEPAKDAFEVCILAHLRPVKDPLTAVRAMQFLPETSRIRVLHLGAVIDPQLGAGVEDEAARTSRYRLLGERPRDEALETLARCRLLISCSRHEGGANAVSEALALDVPVLATRIPGALGLLGEDYPGTHAVGDAAALAKLLDRAETDAEFLDELRARCRERAWVTSPDTEHECWKRLLAEIHDEPGGTASK